MNKDTVLTIDGTVVEKSKCRNIRGEFYIIGDPTIENSGHCYFINEKYYKQDLIEIIYKIVKPLYNGTKNIYDKHRKKDLFFVIFYHFSVDCDSFANGSEKREIKIGLAGRV